MFTMNPSILPAPEKNPVLSSAPSPINRIFGALPFHTDGAPQVLAFGSDGSLWSVEEPGVLRRWDASSGRQLEWRFLSDLETLWSFSADARLLASANKDV